MLKEGIPFVWEGHQIYLPFLGILLDDHPRQEVPACIQISYLTQKADADGLVTGMAKSYSNASG